MINQKNLLYIILFLLVIGVLFQLKSPFKAKPKLTTAPAQLSTTGVDEAAHAMEAIPGTGVKQATIKSGLQELPYKTEGDTKVFQLTAQAVKWPILKDVIATAWSYNGMIPGPLIHVTEGDKVKILVKNNLSVPTTIHWHGIQVPNDMDGIPDETQKPILPGKTFTYTFVAKPAGTYWYHSHYESDKQIAVGLSGAFIIDPLDGEANKPAIDKVLMLNEWRILNGKTYAAMPATNMDGNYFTINGKAFPDTETINAKVGQKIRLRFVGSGQMIHPMHLHGFPFKITETDGNPVPEIAQLMKDTIAVAPGERYVIEFTPDRPGKWMLHCHIPHHTSNAHQEPGGLMMVVNVVE